MTDPLALTLIVPVGVETKIFPWGVSSIRDYLAAGTTPVDVSIWDLRDDPELSDLRQAIRPLERDIFGALSKRYRDVFDVNRASLPFGVLAALGDGYFDVAERNGLGRSRLALALARRRFGPRLAALKTEIERYLERAIAERAASPDGRRAIFGLSVYDRTLFDCLWLSRLIRRTCPDALILLGGDYFTFANAKQVVEHAGWVDGVVVGYGEDVMRAIVEAHHRGDPVRRMVHKGLVNEVFGGKDEPRPTALVPHAGTDIPSTYQERFKNSPIRWVRISKPGEVRMMTQRGCSWGKCAFCTQLDRMLFFPIDQEQLLSEVKATLDEAFADPRVDKVRLSVDSDESATNVIIDLIGFLAQYAGVERPITLNLWFQVKEFTRELAAAILAVRGSALHVHLEMNMESLNTNTLSRMKKGHSPLKSIESLKAAIDCGATLTSNYFNHYPLENSDNVAEEVHTVQSIAHLLAPPLGRVRIFPYCANDRDVVWEDPDKYRVDIERLAGDIWIREVFGFDLPFSVFSFNYTERHPIELERWLVYSYHEAIKAKVNREPLGVLGWAALHAALGAAGRKHAYLERVRLFRHLNQLNAAYESPGDEELGTRAVVSGPARQSHFYLRGQALYKDYHTPGCTENWSLALEKRELSFLRYLYWTRKRGDVFARFEGELTVAEIQRLIDRHLALGTLLSYKTSLLCVVNDPEFWQSAERTTGAGRAATIAPVRRKRLAVVQA